MPDNANIILGATLRARREALGLTQARLEELAGYPKGYWYRKELGRVKIMGRDLLVLEALESRQRLRALVTGSVSEFNEAMIEIRQLIEYQDAQNAKAEQEPKTD